MSMFANRKVKYYTPDFTASRDERISRLKHELRQHIRCLSSFEFLSPEWLRMAQSLEQIAKVAFMETSLPISVPNVANQQGRKDDGTLWDQERDEIAVRILLEEGKLNLCLRLLQELKEAQSNADAFASKVSAAQGPLSMDHEKLQTLLRTYEESLGLLLKIALQHVEAMQIIDLPLLIAHCTFVAITVANQDQPTADNVEVLDKLQDTHIVLYLACMVMHIEHMDEDRIGDLLEDSKTLDAIITLASKKYAWFSEDTRVQFARFFSGFFGSEGFQTEPDRFVSADNAKACYTLKAPLFDDLIEANSDREFKKKIRNFDAQLSKWRRKYKL